jgi:hypothetical protein
VATLSILNGTQGSIQALCPGGVGGNAFGVPMTVQFLSYPAVCCSTMVRNSARIGYSEPAAVRLMPGKNKVGAGSSALAAGWSSKGIALGRPINADRGFRVDVGPGP